MKLADEDEKRPPRNGQFEVCATGGGLVPAGLGLAPPGGTTGAPRYIEEASVTGDDPGSISGSNGGPSPATPRLVAPSGTTPAPRYVKAEEVTANDPGTEDRPADRSTPPMVVAPQPGDIGATPVGAVISPP